MQRYYDNPVLKREDIPEIKPHLVDVSSVFNPGAIKFNNQYLLILRVQNRGRETFFVKATSDDGINFKVDNKYIEFIGLDKLKEKYYQFYDARITYINSKYYIMFAIDFDSSCGLGLAVTEDFKNYNFLGLTSNWDTRNGVLFPEKFGKKYLRLERPNAVKLKGGPTSGSTIVLAESEDLLNWEIKDEVMTGRFHYWDELIGSGPPPVKTKEGWLHIYHGVATHFGSANIYQAGVVLLDLENPAKVIARSKYNILEPRELYEIVGQVPNVVFPSGMIVEEYDENGFAIENSNVNIYYGAADTSIGLVQTTIKKLIEYSKS